MLSGLNFLRNCEGRKTRGNPRSGTAYKTQPGKGNTDCHGHKCPRNDVGKYTRVGVSEA